MQNILVIGANGKTGRIISKVLRDSMEFKPYAMIRKDIQKPFFKNLGIETRLGDLEEDFSDAFKGIDKVIFAAGSGGNTSDEKTVAIDQQGAIRAVEFAKAHKLQKFVMLSSMGTDAPNRVEGLENYLKAKKAADDFLRESKMVYTIVQPGGLTNEKGNQKVEISKSLKKMGQISREDVAQALVYALELERTKNTSFEMISGQDDLKQSMKNFK
ncbi:SDR family oxidoreductase [Psychroflexus sp. CAK57W]|uniref:SDR family oxidoreductase n=1 Tax=Psychroflexus curvus TaxID=2873595 RepID=UPI001CCFD86A|nr:SDR family oxidoreductase [Psychroflexus curvus]MBZ9628479.1 SDR family oxidoreductase [Psychroflexus curvus]MBZ9788073.1 SDR family oxidoreductase [Psychroflexus curvus]